MNTPWPPAKSDDALFIDELTLSPAARRELHEGLRATSQPSDGDSRYIVPSARCDVAEEYCKFFDRTNDLCRLISIRPCEGVQLDKAGYLRYLANKLKS